MKSTITHLVPSDIRTLKPYVSARMLNKFDPASTYLDANESPFRFPLTDIDYSELQHYSDTSRNALEAAYANYVRLPRESVLATRGIDEGIDLITRAFCEPRQDKIMIFPPTFGGYQAAAAAHRCEVLSIPLTNEFALDFDEIEKQAPPKVVFYCRPNNPTGHAFGREELLRLLDYVDGRSIVAVDEAYMEFAPEDAVLDLLPDHPNMAILRTMSKAFGLAGIHTGFSIAAPELIRVLLQILNPYPIPDPCARLAMNALSEEGLRLMRRNAAAIREIRDEFAPALAQVPGCNRVYPSVTNFLLANFADAEDVYEKLKSAGLFIRPLPEMFGRTGWLRFSIGAREDMARVLDVLGAPKGAFAR